MILPHSTSTLFFASILVALVGCGGQSGPTPEGPIPGPGTPPSGDCHSTPGAVAEVFSPVPLSTEDVPDSALLVVGDRVYASLLAGNGKNGAYGEGIWVGSSANADGWASFASIPGQLLLAGHLTLGRDHIYFPVEVLQTGGSATPPDVKLGYRRSDGAIATVDGTDMGLNAVHTVRGDTAFTFSCPRGGPQNDECGAPGATWTLTATSLGTNARAWNTSIANADAGIFSRLLADDENLYWTTPDNRVLRIPIGGGDVAQVPLTLGASETIVELSRAGDALLVGTHGPRDGAMTNEIALYRLPLTPTGFGSATRISLGRTFMETLRMVFDQASVYFVYDTPGALAEQGRILARACLDGTNPTIVLRGQRWGTYSMEDVALSDARIFFTAQNRVYALAK